jgi:hypothetical protein
VCEAYTLKREGLRTVGKKIDVFPKLGFQFGTSDFSEAIENGSRQLSHESTQ